MLTRILEWSLHHRAVVLVAWLGVIVAGVLSAVRIPLDAYPDTTPVQVQVNTVAPSLGPLEIERQITTPIEWSISGLPSLGEVRSVSKFGFSQVVVTFKEGTDIYLARQVVAERLNGVELPPGIERPTLGPVATGLGEVFHYLVTGSGPSLAKVREAQDWIIKPQLRSVSGVAEVNSWGGDERQLQVVVDPTQLQRFDLSLSELAEAVEQNNANVGGGTLDLAGESSLIQGVGLATSADDVAEMVVAARDGVPVRVRDVARVVEGREIRRGAVTADGRGEAVLGLGFMLMGENSRDVTRDLRLQLGEIEKTLPEGVHVEPVYERTTLVDRVLRTAQINLFEGALLVIAVLLAFLGNLRAGLIVASAIPLSMLFASNLMLRAGVAGSLMSLGAIDFGLVVDSSVVQAENVIRRSPEARAGKPWLDVVRDAVVEVRKPTLFGELIIAIVYLPILTLEGVEGKLFRPMALTVIFALAGSMLLSLTLLPVLLSFGLGRHAAHRENALVRWLKRRYRATLSGALARPAVVIGTSLLLLAGAGVLGSRLGSEFVPRLWEGSVVINKVQLAGVSVEESVRTSTQLERMLLEKYPDEVERVWTRIGTAEIATDPMGLELADLFITLKPEARWTRARTQQALVRRMSDEFSSFPGMRLIYTQPIEMRVSEMIAGIRADVGVRLFGDDLELLKSKAREIETVLKGIDGAADVFTEQITGQPVIEIVVDRAAVARHGIPAREVLASVQSLGTRQVGLMYEGERRFPIALRIDDAYRTNEEALGKMLVAAANGDRVPLGQLAHIRTIDGPSTIQREWGKRRIVIQANVRGRDLGSFVAEARTKIDREVERPSGYFVRYGGQFEHLERARARLLIVVPIALGLILTLLLFTYRRWQDTARVFVGIPFAAVGGVLALWARGMPFTISAGVGFIVLSGVSVLGDMILVSTIRQRLAAGAPLRAAIEDAAETRLRPVLMTSLVAALGFLPMALNTSFGAEVQRPLATVVVGGLLSSTLLTLFVLPVLYDITGPRAASVEGTAKPPNPSGEALAE
ncbi:MAG: efflux RND transporter permease subunit [Polyangiaceae bacterium]|nr:efflux RND transporter permease subunit [Polyangiaceae bacterium]MCW5789715.1 efflux RND transporter permease subunit [Polyangiaceae bacterium]